MDLKKEPPFCTEFKTPGRYDRYDLVRRDTVNAEGGFYTSCHWRVVPAEATVDGRDHNA